MSNLGELMPDGMAGAVVIVTGGGSGIGAATARRLGALGAPVVLVGRRPEPLHLAQVATHSACPPSAVIWAVTAVRSSTASSPRVADFPGG
jgi:NAD(P)-dependent dehydrogenase (short-subunit alcohol dehydrogenase family)